MKLHLSLLAAFLCSCGLAQTPLEGPSVKIPGIERSAVEQADNSKRAWRSLAPGFVNVPVAVKIDGQLINILVDIGGMLQSRDGGKTWRTITFNNYDGITCWEYWDFDIDPASPERYVIGGQLLFRSADGGKSWQELKNGLPASLNGERGNSFGQVRFNCDGSLLVTAEGANRCAPVSYEKLIMKRFTKKQVFLSSDKGDSFKTVTIDSAISPARRIVTDPSDPNRFLISFADGELYVCDNAKSESPALRRITLPEDFYAMDFCPVPGSKDRFSMAMNSINAKPPKAMLATLSLAPGSAPTVEPIAIKDAAGAELKEGRIFSVGWNPNKAGQFVVGVSATDYILISDDSMKSFRRLSLPKELYGDDKLGHFYGEIERVTFGNASPYAVLNSRIGTWITDDNFKTIRNLTMRYEDGLFSNNGAGMPANINNIAVTKGHVIYCAQDHGLWISNGSDLSKWRLLTGKDAHGKFPLQPAPWGTPYTWLHEVQRMFASHDEQFLYISCNALMKKKFKHSFWADKKLFLSHDMGTSWEDVTARLGRGDIYPEGSSFNKILFMKGDSSKQWFLFSDALYFTADGAKTFKKLESPLFSGVSNESKISFSDIAFDKAHGILYLGLNPDRFLPGPPAGFNALLKSSDMGETWTPVDIQQNSVRSLDVMDSGDLVIGTQLSGSKPARLIVLPFGAKYDPSMIKLTAGDLKREREANQVSIWPVACDGKNIFAYSNIEWFHSDKFFSQGPLLSTDGGKTFQWILDDLPNTNVWSATMGDGKILLGTTSGLMFREIK